MKTILLEERSDFDSAPASRWLASASWFYKVGLGANAREAFERLMKKIEAEEDNV